MAIAETKPGEDGQHRGASPDGWGQRPAVVCGRSLDLNLDMRTSAEDGGCAGCDHSKPWARSCGIGAVLSPVPRVPRSGPQVLRVCVAFGDQGALSP